MSRTPGGQVDTQELGHHGGETQAGAGSVRQRLVAASGLVERREELAGVATAFLEGGDGPPMVLLHGQGEFWGVWLGVLGDLTATHHVVVVDLPGHGATAAGSTTWDRHAVEAWLDAVVGICDAPPVLVGHLLGGAIAARYAAGHGDRLSHLVLVDTLGLGWFRPSPRFVVPMVRFLVRPTRTSRDRFFRECFVDFDRVGRNFGESWEDVREYALDRARQPASQAVLRSLMPRLGVPPIPADELARITPPTTLVHGRHDLQVDVSLAEEASRRHGWPLHVIEDVRDDPAAEAPAAFVEVLRSALGVEPGTGDRWRASSTGPGSTATRRRDS